METALASVALAGNIVQFIGVARSIISRGAELKRSYDGKLKEHKDILAVVADLERWLVDLDVDCNDTLMPIVNACKDVATRLKDALTRASKSHHVWSHYKEAIALVWNRKQIEETEQQLTRLLDGISHHLQATMRHDVGAILERVGKLESQLEEAQVELHDLTKAQTSSVGTLRDCIEASTTAIVSQCGSSHVLPAELHLMIRELYGFCKELITDRNNITGNQDGFSSRAPIRKDFIDTFTFWAMDDREDSIPKAHARTYEWILMDPEHHSSHQNKDNYRQERYQLQAYLLKIFSELGLSQTTKKYPFHFQVNDKDPTAHLQRWFESGKGIFWIWGKPGCGKSTLMKAMLQKPHLRRRLKALLNSNKPKPRKESLIASFYLFRPGMTLQKSKVGLLQSILFQILRARTSLVNQIFSIHEQRQAVKRHEKVKGSDEPVWTLEGLKRAFQKLVAVDDLQLYLHIDGIDEIDCSPIEIAKLLCELAKHPNVKILAAGRYHGEFQQMFPERQALNLHELTEMDILRFAVDELRQLHIFKPGTNPQPFIDILKEITSSAQGVFQWVNIVVESLIQGSHYYENFGQLFKRLQEYPKELDDLYHFLYRRIEERHLPDTAFWLLCVLGVTRQKSTYGRATKRLTTRDIWIAEQIAAGNDDVIKTMIHLNSAKRSRIAHETQLRMQAQGRHFFDFGPRSENVKYVTFAHRTVLDFLIRKDRAIVEQLENHLPTDSDHVFARTVAENIRSSRIEDWPNLFKQPEGKEMSVKIATSYIQERGIERICDMWLRLTGLLDSMTIPYGSNTEKILSPTTVGWVIETESAMFHRLEGISPAPLFYLLARRRFESGEADIGKFDSVLSDTAPLRLSETQREFLLLLRFFSTGNGMFYLERIAVEKYLASLFPEKVPRQSVCLSRLLEWIRIFEGELFAKLNATSPWELWMLQPIMTTSNIMDVVALLISRGANANLMCKSVANDPDKSHLSVMSILLKIKHRVYDLLQKETMIEIQNVMSDKTPNFQGDAPTDYDTQQMLLRQQNKRRLLMARQEQDTVNQTQQEIIGQKKPAIQMMGTLEKHMTEAIKVVEAEGGKEIVVPRQMHGEPDIEPLSASLRYFGNYEELVRAVPW